MNIMQCEDYAVISSNNTLKIFLQKKDLIKSPQEIFGGIFSVKKHVKGEDNTTLPNLNFNISLTEINENVLNTLSLNNKAQIIVYEEDKIVQIFDSKLIKVV